MQLLIFFSLIIVFLFIVSRKAISFFRLNFVRDQRAWSGQDIKINRKDLTGVNSTSSNTIKNNYSEIIADESKVFLEEQS